MSNVKCKICGTEFPALVERHYIARDTEKSGIAAAFSSDEPALFDAFDCPNCGCQVIVQQRKLSYNPGIATAIHTLLSEEEEEDEEEQESV